jgi:hypothetical protein
LRNLNCSAHGRPRLRAQPSNDMPEEPFHIGVRKLHRAGQQAAIESFRLMLEAAKPRGYNVVTGTHIIFSLDRLLIVFLSAFYFIELDAKLLLLTKLDTFIA